MKRLYLLIGCTALSLFAASPRRNSPGPPTSIRLVNFQVIPAATLARGEAAASRYLADAGVNVTWVHCAPPDGPNPCCRPIPPGDVSLQVLRRSPANMHADTAGFAVLYPGASGVEGYGAVSYPDVQRVARLLEHNEWEVLGIVLAHEIGHLLLGSSGHSHEGIMSPRIGAEQMELAGRGELRFTAAEAARIQLEIRRRSPH